MYSNSSKATKNYEEELHKQLVKRKQDNAFRQLKVDEERIDFYSNDYLGIVYNKILDAQIAKKLSSIKKSSSGSTGSRLLSGNTLYAEQLERRIALYYNVPSALLFNSGYDANIGLLSSVATRHDTIIYDELCHASIIDGIRLSHATRKYKFKHNDLTDLKKKLNKSSGVIFIVVESIYSMDGDQAPLKELVNIASLHQAALIVDEAHATGVFGKGLVTNLKLENYVFARVHTFGKALGCHGSVVLGSETLKSFLINFARSFIYTTALPLHALVTIGCAYDYLENETSLANQLQELIDYFKTKLSMFPKLNYIDSVSPIQAIVIGGNERTKYIAQVLQEDGLMIKPILHPTVPKGKERLRICLHSFNTKDEIDRIFTVLKKFL